MIKVTDRVAEHIQAVSPGNQNLVNQGASSVERNSKTGKSHQESIPSNKIHLADSDISYSSLQVKHENLNKLANTIRRADEIMSEVGQLIKESRVDIKEYEKLYPPYQDENSDRVKLLKSLIGLRKQIDDLTFAPDFKDVARIVGDPASADDAEDPVYYSMPIRQHEVHTGPDGLNIASISTEANNTAIRQFGQELAYAEHKLERRRLGLAKDAKLLADELSVGEKMLQTGKDAEVKSQEVQQQLVSLGEQLHLSGSGSSLLERLT